MARQTKAELAAIEQANIKAAQQAELKRLRAEKRKAGKAAAAHAKAVQPEVTHTDIEMLFDDVQLPSAKRVMVGFLLALGASFATGYGIGMLMAYALAGIMTLTSTAWIAFTLSVLVWVIGLYAAWKVGGYVGGKVFSSVVMPDGLASRSYESVANAASNTKSKIGGWFTTTKVDAADQAHKLTEKFSGAFTRTPSTQAAA